MTKANQYDDSTDLRFQFFQRNRRKILMEGINTQVNGKTDDRKVVLSFMLPITGQKLTGLPQFLQPAFEAIEKEHSLIARAPLEKDFHLEGMTLEFFSQEDSKERICLLTNKTLYDFCVEREPEGDTLLSVLRFKLRTKETMGVYGFWCKHGVHAIWTDFTPCENAVKEEDDKQMTLAAAS